MNALKFHLKNIFTIFTLSSLFSKIPIIKFMPQETCCCHRPLTVLKTRKRTLVTLLYGKFLAHETVYYCKKCKRQYCSNEIKSLIPDQCSFGFDIITFIGKALYIERHRNTEVQHRLKEKKLLISLREIAYLGNKYITYLAIAPGISRFSQTSF